MDKVIKPAFFNWIVVWGPNHNSQAGFVNLIQAQAFIQFLQGRNITGVWLWDNNKLHQVENF